MSENSMKGRGRNGMFDIEETKVVQTAGGHTTWIEVFSRRTGNMAPLMIVGDTMDVLRWAKSIVQGIEHGIVTLGCQEIQRKAEIKEPIELTKEDWVELYYALTDKIESVPSTDRFGVKWRKHLKAIQALIGPDGEDAAREGVKPA